MNGATGLRFEHERKASLEMVGGFDSLADEVTIALVLHPAGTNAHGRFLSFGADLVDEEVGLNDNDVFRAVRASSPQDYAFVDHAESTSASVIVMAFGAAPDSLALWVDGERATSAPAVQGSPRVLGYVARTLRLAPIASPADFDLGELLVVRRLLTDAEIATLSLTLGAKWSIPVRTADAGVEGGDPVRFPAVLAVLKSHACTACHFPASATGGEVDLTTYAGVKAFVVPGTPATSRLWLALDRMEDKPGASKLAPSERDLLSTWIAQGAPE
jgi:hypothetical protein